MCVPYLFSIKYSTFHLQKDTGMIKDSVIWKSTMTTIPRYPVYTEEAQPHIHYKGEAHGHIVTAIISLQNFHIPKVQILPVPCLR